MIEMAFVLFVLLALMGWAVLLSWVTDLPIGTTLLPVFCGALLVANLGVVSDLATLSRAVVVIGGLVAFAAMSVLRAKRLGELLRQPDAALMLVGAVVLCVVSINAEFSARDEFSHWGKVAKFIALTGSAPANATYVGFMDYPIGLAALGTTFLWPGYFSEPAVVAAHGILVLACFAGFIGGLRWRDGWIGGLVVVLLFTATYLMHRTPWAVVLPDTVMALVAAAAIAIYWRVESGWRILLVAPLLAALPLMKDTGILLSGTVAILIGVDIVIRFGTGRHVGATAGAFLASILVMATTLALWRLHIAQVDAAVTFATDSGNFLQRLGAEDFGQRAAVIAPRFWQQLLTDPIVNRRAPTLPAWIGAALLLALTSMVVGGRRDTVTRIAAANIVLAVMLAVYASGLLLLYLFSFNEREGLALASFRRYVGTYAVFGFAANLGLLISLRADGRVRRVIVAAALCGIAIGALTYAHRDIQADMRRYWDGVPGDSDVRAARSRLRTLFADAPDGSIYFLWPGGSGRDYYAAKFELLPRKVDALGGCFSPGPVRYPGDEGVCDITPDVQARLMAERDYVLLVQSDDVFWELYGHLFADGARASGAIWFRSGEDGRLQPAP